MSNPESRIYSFPTPNIELISVRTMLNINAYQKPATAKPSITQSVINMIMAFITSRNKPRVKTVKGMVSITRIGFTNVFNNDKIMATSKAVRKESTETPGKT